MTDASRPMPARPGGPVRALCLVGAIGAAGLLAFAAFAKAYGLSKGKDLFSTFGFEHGVLIAEVVILALVLALHRRWFTWVGVAVLFAGFSGYTFYHVISGGSCGCLGAWTPPSPVMFAIDLAAVLMAVGLAYLARAPRHLLAAGVFAALSASFVGHYVSFYRSPEGAMAKYDGQDAKARLLACDLGAEMKTEGGPAYLVFIHEIGCHTCELYLDTMEQWRDQLDAENNPRLRVRVWSKDEVFDACGIEDWAWEGPPHSFVVMNGVPAAFPNGDAMEWLGEDTPFTLVDDLKAMLETDSMYGQFN